MILHKFLNDILNGRIFHLPIPGVLVEFDPSSYTVNEVDGSVTFMIAKRNETTLEVTVNFSTVPDSAKGDVGNVTLDPVIHLLV